NRKNMPQVSYAGIRVSDHGEFSEKERSALRALRVSPQALALGEMVRALPESPPASDDPWAALHDLYRFLTFIGCPAADGRCEWEEIPEAGLAATRTHRARPAQIKEGEGHPSPPPPPPPPPPPTSGSWQCA